MARVKGRRHYINRHKVTGRRSRDTPSPEMMKALAFPHTGSLEQPSGIYMRMNIAVSVCEWPL